MTERQTYTPEESKGTAPRRGRLADKRILVVRGGQMDIGEDDTPVGNGRAMCALFSREGAHVAVADRDAKAAEGTVALCGGSAFAITADVTKDGDVARMVDETHGKLGGLDGLVLNVGVGAGGPWLEGTTRESWDKVLAINLT